MTEVYILTLPFFNKSYFTNQYTKHYIDGATSKNFLIRLCYGLQSALRNIPVKFEGAGLETVGDVFIIILFNPEKNALMSFLRKMR